MLQFDLRATSRAGRSSRGTSRLALSKGARFPGWHELRLLDQHASYLDHPDCPGDGGNGEALLCVLDSAKSVLAAAEGHPPANLAIRLPVHEPVLHGRVGL